jgi:hypothetical protein
VGLTGDAAGLTEGLTDDRLWSNLNVTNPPFRHAPGSLPGAIALVAGTTVGLPVTHGLPHGAVCDPAVDPRLETTWVQPLHPHTCKLISRFFKTFAKLCQNFAFERSGVVPLPRGGALQVESS